MFNPTCRRKMVCESFPNFMLARQDSAFVTCFNYLGHITENSTTHDADINRQIKNLSSRTNLLIHNFFSLLRIC